MYIILGIFIFIIMAMAAKTLFGLLFLLFDVLLGKKEFTLEQIKNNLTAVLMLVGIFICIGGLFYFSNDENGHLAWHILIYNALFGYIISRDLDFNSSKAEKGVLTAFYLYPFVWAVYSGFASTVYIILVELMK